MLILLNICHQKKNLRRIRDIGVFSESIVSCEEAFDWPIGGAFVSACDGDAERRRSGHASRP
jgi:hypothetical protein